MTKLLTDTLRKNKGADQDKLLKSLKQTYLTHRQIGLSEAVYRLFPFMHMKEANTKCIFVPTGFPENRSVLFKRAKEEDQDEEQYENGEECQSGNEFIEIEGRKGKFEQTVTMHDRYMNRPDVLEPVCFAQYTTLYTPIKKLPKKAVMVNGASEQFGFNSLFSDPTFFLPRYLELKNPKLGYMSQRGHPCVLRIHTSKKKEGHEMYYADLLLYVPWRNETEEFFRNDPIKCLNMFMEKINILSQNQNQMFPFSDEIDAIQEAIENGTFDERPSHIYDMLDAQGEQQDDDDNAQGPDDDPEYAGRDPSNLTEEQKNTDNGQGESFKFKKIDVEEHNVLMAMTRKLVPEQMVPLNKAVGFCKGVVKSRNPNVDYPEPIYVVIHGGAGVGKSAVIRIISKWCEKILRKAGDHPNKPRVLIAGPTGMASAVINGTTLHAAFDFKFGNNHVSLSDKKLDEYRNMFENLHLIIIDEMSMVGADMLIRIHRRLCEIFQSHDLFAGKSVILVGDLLQLPPVKAKYIFQEPSNQDFKVFHEVCPLWETFEPVVLDHNHRQGEEKVWATTLNRLREGIVSEEDNALLTTRLTTTDEAPSDCCHIFYTNLEVLNYNMKMLDRVNSTEFVIPAIIYGPNGYQAQTKSHGTIDDSNFMKILTIKVGARIMLVINVNTCDDLVNGTFGSVMAVIQKTPGIVDCIIVQFDNEIAGNDHKKKYPVLSKQYQYCNGTPIYRHSLEYITSSSRGNTHTGRAKIHQFPLRLAWASTCHKVH
jgi:hypothetical protein